MSGVPKGEGGGFDDLMVLLTHHKEQGRPVAEILEEYCTLGQILAARASIPIVECGEEVEMLDKELFVLAEPHAYLSIGAPYGEVSPFFFRRDIARRLKSAAQQLLRKKPGHRLLVFDGFRPLGVQAFMRDWEFRLQADNKEWQPELLNEHQRTQLWQVVDQMWAPATRDEALPPPHATAAAVDLTIVDPDGNRLNMGSDIDENSERMLPGYYRNQDTVTAKVIEGNREILNAVMCAAGFRRNTHEWWHFSRGDQFWALLESLDTGVLCPAIYGFARLQ